MVRPPHGQRPRNRLGPGRGPPHLYLHSRRRTRPLFEEQADFPRHGRVSGLTSGQWTRVRYGKLRSVFHKGDSEGQWIILRHSILLCSPRQHFLHGIAAHCPTILKLSAPGSSTVCFVKHDVCFLPITYVKSCSPKSSLIKTNTKKNRAQKRHQSHPKKFITLDIISAPAPAPTRKIAAHE